MTIWLKYTLTPEARISAGSSGEVLNARSIHHVLPGSVIRGALGSAWWNDHDDSAADRFHSLFSDQLDVMAAVPKQGEHEGTTAELQLMSQVRCKYPPPHEGPDVWHDLCVGAYDRCRIHRPDQCPGTLEHGRGWKVPNEWETSATRTALENGVAAKAQLFTRRQIHTWVHFTGFLALTDDVTQESLAWLQERRQIFVGGQLSTLGRTQWVCQPVDAPYQIPDTSAAALQLLAPSILLDEFGAPTLDLAAAILAVADAAGSPVTVMESWTRPVALSGWHGLAGFPKPEDWALEAGSVAHVSDLTATSRAALAAGLGIRRREGFGVVRLIALDELPDLRAGNRPAAAPESPPVVVDPGTPELETGPLEETPSVAPGTPADTSGKVLGGEDVPSSPSSHALSALLGGLLRDQQSSVVKALVAESRAIDGMREKGLPSHTITKRIDNLFRRPWAKPILGREKALHALFAAAPQSDLTAALQAWTEEDAS